MKAKNFAFVVGLFMLFIMSACQRAEVKERICSKDNAFAVTDKALYRSIGVTCQIESWLIAGDEIVITSTNPDSLFYSSLARTSVGWLFTEESGMDIMSLSLH